MKRESERKNKEKGKLSERKHLIRRYIIRKYKKGKGAIKEVRNIKEIKDEVRGAEKRKKEKAKYRKRLKMLLAAVLVFFIEIEAVYILPCFPMSCVFAEELPELSLYARSALLLDASNNRVLYEENGYQVMAMASTTKIMTCMLAIESGRLEETVEVSKNAQRMPKVHLGMRAGETYKLKDLLYSLMLESHNDTAVAIAEHLGGSVEGFADMMNAKAAELGCKDTYFITPNGLDAKRDGKTHSTTARDLAVIAAYAIKNPAFLEVIGTRSYSFSELSGKRNFQVSNKNRFLDMMEGAIGIKTGFTCDAGYCFVGAIQRDGKTFISVVLGAGWPPNKTWKWHDTKILMKFGLKNFEIKNIYEKTTYGKMEVLNGVEQQVEIGAEQKDISLLLSSYDQVEMKQTFPKQLEAPVEKGTVIGYETYYVNGQKWTEIPIVTKRATEAFTWQYCLDKILRLFFTNNSQNVW